MVKISITGFNNEPVNETNNDNTLETIEEEYNDIGTFSGGGSTTWSVSSSGYKVYEGQKITLDIHVPTSQTTASAKTYNLYYPYLCFYYQHYEIQKDPDTFQRRLVILCVILQVLQLYCQTRLLY